ncbi:MAG: hypothetical protein HN353_12545 [Bdellovibrionales bacterium]|nr:hypothetical protein [Bdellovibrionales bacterium]MBT3526345.1 hypothetical protein [Bdellovibrionales bacterium]MBT7668624.1 hypothetical protein [Bdellovibrionales bacterium]MBT7767544.1 hypothetical protein [Bdellovibrionales bacterium]
MIKLIMLLALMNFLFLSCGKRTIEDYGDLNSSPAGISIEGQEEHRGGHGRTECLVCHNAALNIHRTAISIVDYRQILELVDDDDRAYEVCIDCHGTNGTGN